MAELKQCRKCPPGILKSTEEFWVSRKGRTRDGLMSTCKECTKAIRREWAARNPMREHESYRRQYEACPEGYIQRAARYRASKRAAKIERIERLIVLERDDGVCGICGGDVNPLEFDIDHIIPLSKNGDHSYDNVQVAHPSCNNQKYTKVVN